MLTPFFYIFLFLVFKLYFPFHLFFFRYLSLLEIPFGDSTLWQWFLIMKILWKCKLHQGKLLWRDIEPQEISLLFFSCVYWYMTQVKSQCCRDFSQSLLELISYKDLKNSFPSMSILFLPLLVTQEYQNIY